MFDQEKTGKFIAENRKQKGLTQKDLAERLGISNKTVSK
ncbi:MAG: helix-turn-helix transcriptional regulator, partial [Lachnospiraceae bacterium]|nr:helix-turn-helix transcriptional regulator [Lachnospiraceae bacterium]